VNIDVFGIKMKVAVKSGDSKWETQGGIPGKDAGDLEVLVEFEKWLFAIDGPGRSGRKMAWGVGVEAASVAVWGRVTGGSSARSGPCRVGALRQCGRRQRDARRRNSGYQCKLGLVDHCLSPEFRNKQGRDAMLFGDQEMCSMQAILN
jgi:hypothetical protein